ncbi:MAG: TetR/AcrR family transcriptional regulator [Gammaproteobacteria bacterium]
MKYHHGNLKKVLLKCACETCETEGAEALSLRGLAKKANVSQTAPYRHFATKQELLACIAEEGFKNLNKQLTKILNDSYSSERDRHIAAGRAYIDFGLNNLNTYNLMFSDSIRDFSMFSGLHVASEDCFQTLKKIIKRVFNLPDEEAELKGMQLWSMGHGLVMILNKRKKAPTQARAQDSTALKLMDKVSANLDKFLEKFLD